MKQFLPTTFLLVLILLLCISSTYAITNVIPMSDCADPTQEYCEILFQFDTKNSTHTLTSTQWLYQLRTVNSVNFGTCLLSGGSTLILQSTPTTNYVKCRFILLDGITQYAENIIIDGTAQSIQFPFITYFSKPFLFTPTTSSCSSLRSLELCEGILSFPSLSLPLIIETTSSISITSTELQFQLISSAQLSGNVNKYIYEITPIDSSIQLLDYIQLPVRLTKSIISNYFFLSTKNNIVYRSPYPIYNDIIITTDSNCYGRTMVLCTLIIEVSKHLPLYDKLSIFPQQYFHSTSGPVTPCPSTITIPNQRSTDDYILLCSTWRKTIHTLPQRASLQGKIDLNLIGPAYNYQIKLPLGSIIYVSPVWVEWNYETCSNPLSSVCKGWIRSFYTGPPMQASIKMPFSSIDYITCNSNQLSIDLGDTIHMPAYDLTTAGMRADVYIPDGLHYNECEVFFVIGYQQWYDFTTTAISHTLSTYKEGYNNVIREGLSVNLVVPEQEDVQFKTWPMTLTANNDCSSSLSGYCTVTFSIDPMKVHEDNFFRSFQIFLPGVDIEHTIKYNDYTITNNGFSGITLTSTLELVNANVTTNVLNQDLLIFAFHITHRSYGRNTFLSPTQSANIILKYRKIGAIYLTPDPNIPGAFPHVYSYGTVQLPQQPPSNEFMPLHPNGYIVDFTSPDSPQFANDCNDETSLLCTIYLHRYRPELTRTYFYGTSQSLSTDEIVSTLTVLRDDLHPIPVHIALVPNMYGIGQSGYAAHLEWKEFKINPDDENEPLPSEIKLHAVKTLGVEDLFTLIVFIMNDDWTTILNQLPYLKDTKFTSDALPTFHNDCTSPINPYCTATYTIHTSIPPYWTIIEHQLPNNDLVNDVQLLSCTNINPAIISTIQPTLVRAGNTDMGGIQREIDFIRVMNNNEYALFQVDTTVPITCDIRFILNNKMSRSRHIIHPFTIHNQTRGVNNHQFEIKTPLPRMDWSPSNLIQFNDCFTSETSIATCTFKVVFYGSTQFPIYNLTKLAPEALSHPLIPYGSHSLYLAPIPPEDIDKDNEYLRCATFSLLRVDKINPDDDTEVQLLQFLFAPLPSYTTKTFTAYWVLKNQVIPNRPIFVPQFKLPVKVNNENAIVPANFNLGAILSGSLMTIDFNQTKFTQGKGISLMLSRFNMNVKTIIIENDLGINSDSNSNNNIVLLPCIQSQSTFALSVQQEKALNYNLYMSIALLQTRDEQLIRLNEIIQQRINDNNNIDGDNNNNNDFITNLHILGWFESIPYEEYIPGTTYTKNRHFTKFTSNNNITTLTETSCFNYIPVNTQFPSHSFDVKHLIQISSPGLDNETVYFYHHYPYLATNAQIKQPKQIVQK